MKTNKKMNIIKIEKINNNNGRSKTITYKRNGKCI